MDKKGEDGKKKYSKIDQSLVNLEWLEGIQECRTNSLTTGVSDYIPVLV